jgi:hypothetical protein
MNEHVFLVGIVVNDANDGGRTETEHDLISSLQTILHSRNTDHNVDSWWIAEDDRHDGSDLDSAVFVKVGEQVAARDALRDLGLSHPLSTFDPSLPLSDDEVIKAAALAFLEGRDDVDLERLADALDINVADVEAL